MIYMSFTSGQLSNNRSMNGIISYDDGNGGILENGELICDNINANEQTLGNLKITNRLDLTGNLNVNSTLITPTWLSYLYGLTSNVQSQISAVSTTLLASANTWTARQTYGNGGLTQYLNTNTVYPTRGGTSAGAIMGHTSDTKALHVVNTNSNLTSYENAFMFEKQDTSSSMINLMRLTNSGELYLRYTLGANSLSYNLGTKQDTINSSNRLDASNIGANGNVSNTEYGYLSNVTSDIQGQFSAKQDTINSSNRLDASNIGANGNVSNTEYGYLSNVTSDLQTQIDSKGGLTTTNTWTQPQTFSDYATFSTSINVASSILAQSISIDSLVVSDVSTLNRQYVSITNITSTTTYTSTDLPSYISCFGFTGTINIPSASSVGAGFILTVVVTDNTARTITITPASGTIRYNDNTFPTTAGAINNVASISIGAGQCVRLIANPTIWSVI